MKPATVVKGYLFYGQESTACPIRLFPAGFILLVFVSAFSHTSKDQIMSRDASCTEKRGHLSKKELIKALNTQLD